MSHKKINYSKLFNQNPKFIPPIYSLLGNTSPYLTGNYLTYSNDNRVFFFLSTAPSPNFTSSDKILNTNIQISTYNFLISSYIKEIEDGKTTYDPNFKIHKDNSLNKFIHKMMSKKDDISIPNDTFLNLNISNQNSIRPLLNYTLNISSFNYILTLVLHILENNPALFFGNNSFSTLNPLNFSFARSTVSVPVDLFYLVYEKCK